MQDSNECGVRLNIGCGTNQILGYLNIDMEPRVSPDLVLDVRKELPFPDKHASEILFFHTIEHIEEKYHELILNEFYRVLQPEGILLLSYPEFAKCANNYISNYKGMREFWKNTIYGLQRYAGDYHVALMDSEDVYQKLQASGFTDIMYREESKEPWNTVVLAHKGKSIMTYEDLLVKELSL